MTKKLRALALYFMTLTNFGVAPVSAENGPGVTDKEIVIGQTMPYSGPASAYATQGRAELAYWKMINSRGGINGRSVKLLSYDDAYSPPKTVEQTRRLVEQDEVFAIVGTLGTPTNAAIQKYLNQRNVPHLFVSSGASKWNDPASYKWTVPLFPPYVHEAQIYAKHILGENPKAKIGVLYQNDDFGKDYLKGFRSGLSNNTEALIKEVAYDVTAPTIDSEIIALKSSGADTLFIVATPKFAAQALKRTYELNWKPARYLVSISSSVESVLKPAGLVVSKDVISATVFKSVGDAAWAGDDGFGKYLQFMREWYPDGNVADLSNLVGYLSSELTALALAACGNDLTRPNLLRQVTSLKEVTSGVLLPRITISFSSNDYSGFRSFVLSRFNGDRWVNIGDPINVD